MRNCCALDFFYQVQANAVYHLWHAALSAVIVSAVVKNVVIPSKLLQLKGTDFIVGVCTALTTAITSPTLGFGSGVIVCTVINTLVSKPKKKEA